MTVCFATIHSSDSFEIRRPKIPKKLLAILNTGYDIKKEHSQSEMRTLPFYRLSQSGMR
jgi:hypothetical protein